MEGRVVVPLVSLPDEAVVPGPAIVVVSIAEGEADGTAAGEGPRGQMGRWHGDFNNPAIGDLEDERLQNPQMQVPPVPIGSLTALALAHPELTIICANAYRGEVLEGIKPSNLHFDISFVDWFKPVDDLLGRLPPERILFGSNTPLFVTRAAVMKVEHADASDAVKRQITGENADRLFQ